MPIDTTVQTIRLGNVDNINPDGGENSENTAFLVNLTFGDANNPLSQNVEDVTFTDANDDGVVRPGGAGGDAINGSLTTGQVGVEATINFSDGTPSATAEFEIAQNENLDLFLIQGPGAENGIVDAAIESGAIESITIDAIRFTVTGGSLNSNIDGNDFIVPICFTAGMEIETRYGPKAAETLEIGDEVRTLDNGFQSVRFVLTNTVPARGQFAPVVFEPGSIGNSKRLIVSQNHRFLMNALKGRFEGKLPIDGLVKAKSLVNGDDIYISEAIGCVTYVHIMLEKHELLFCDGTISESWQPNRRALRKVDPETHEEILRLFPELKFRTKNNGGSWVRPEYGIPSIGV